MLPERLYSDFESRGEIKFCVLKIKKYFMRTIPGPKVLPVVGTALSLMASGGATKLHLYVDKRHKELGPIYQEQLGCLRGVFVSDANYMRKIFGAEGKYPKHFIPEPWLLYNKTYKCKRGLLFMEHEEWLKFRKIMNNMMLKKEQDDFFEPINAVAENLINSWKEGGPVVNLEKQLYKWSLEVVIAILLGTENYLRYKPNLDLTIDKVGQIVHQIFIETANLSNIPLSIAFKFNLPVWRRFVKCVSSTIEEGTNMVLKLMEIENQNPGNHNMLSQMLNTEMEEEDIKRIVTDLVLAAGDTTAHTTQWLLHMLSLDIPCQRMIYNQLKEVPDNEAYKNHLLKGALKEALRLCPVATFITRYLPNNFVLDGYILQPKDLILMSLYSVGRNEIYFPDSESFKPQRWTRENNNYQGVTNPNAFLPFAMGSRSCVGKKIAETQILVTTAKILKNFTIKSGNGKRVDITLHLISVPAEEIQLILEKKK